MTLSKIGAACLAAAALFCAHSALAVPVGSGPPMIQQSQIGQPTAHGVMGVAGLDANARVAPKNVYPEQLHGVCKNWALQLAGNSSNGTTTSGMTTRRTCTPLATLSRIALVIAGNRIASGQEIPLQNPVFYQATIENPLGVTSNGGVTYTPPYFSADGQTTMELEPSAPYLQTDDVGEDALVGQPFAIRLATGVVFSPTPTATPAVPVAGGSLAAGPYYYELTCKKGDSESGPSAEFSGTTSNANLSLSLTWTLPTQGSTPSWVGCDQIRIYRGSTPSSETYLTSLPFPSMSYLDSGQATPVAGFQPVSYSGFGQHFPFKQYLLDGMGSTGATNANAVASVNTNAFNQAGPLSAPNVMPDIILGNDTHHPTLCSVSDSVGFGLGIQALLTPIELGPEQANWFDASTPANQYNTINMSVSGTPASALANANGYYGGNARVSMLKFCNNVVSDLSINDFLLGKTWQQLASAQLQLAQSFAFNSGGKYYITTLGPNIVASDNGLTLAGQTINSLQEAQRTAYNLWVRNGFQVDGNGNPVQSGGTSSPYINGEWDMARAEGEVNSSGVPTDNGGYFPVPSAPIATGVLNGTPTITSLPFASLSGLSGSIHTLAEGLVLKMTSGAQSGKSCVISDNTTTVISCQSAIGTPLPGAPASGDTFALYQTFTNGDVHPNLVENEQMATMPIYGFEAWMQSSGFTSF